MEQKQIDAYVKYNTFDKEQGVFRIKRKKIHVGLHWDNSWKKIGGQKKRTKSGYLQISSAYSGEAVKIFR